MDCQQSNNTSIIITGNNVNHQTFAEEDSCTSLESTVLAGNFPTDNTTDVKINKDLTIVTEEDTSLALNDDEDDILNINIDAISSDNEVFFDCPCYFPQYSPKKTRVPSVSCNDKYGKFLTVSSEEYIDSSTFDSGVHARTGSLLAEMMKDFNNLSSEAQSTPNYQTDNESFSASKNSLEQKRSRSKISCNDYSRKTRNKSGKENISPVEWKPAGRVAKMKEFFEGKDVKNFRNNQTSEISTFAKKKLKSANSPTLKSPTYRTTTFLPKLVITPARRSPAPISRSTRQSSCSEYASESSNESESLRSQRINTFSTRPTMIINRKTTLHRNSLKGQSAIVNRRSIGIEAKHSKLQVKPVRDLRKQFNINANNETELNK